MKYLLFLGLFFGMLTSFAQDSGEKISYESLLATGELFSFENKSIKFKKVISDSRCPKDVTCIWAGEAKVLIAVLENGKEVEEKIISLKQTEGFSFGFSDSKNVYSLDALDLYPYPTSTHKIKDSEYCLKIQLSKS